MCIFGYGDEAVLLKDSAVIFKKLISEGKKQINTFIKTKMKVSAVRKIEPRKELASDGNRQYLMVVMWG